jgi:hypothetical protein
MKRRHSITPTDAGKPLPPNPLWSRSPPVTSKDGKVVWVDAMVLPSVTAHNVAAEKNGNGRNWGRGW